MRTNGVKQPNSRNCYVCGVQNPGGLKLAIYEVGPEEVEATFRPAPEHEGFPGVLHGGIIAALLDELGGRAALIGDHSHFRMTAKLEIKYRAPTPLDQTLTVRGRLLKERGRLALAHTEVRLPDGSVTAEAEVTLADLPDGILPEGSLEALGWKVYD